LKTSTNSKAKYYKIWVRSQNPETNGEKIRIIQVYGSFTILV